MSAERGSYLDFSASLNARVLAQRIPVNVTIEVTRRCPLECVHCYNNLPMSDDGARHGELTLAEHVKLLDELAAEGCLWILYTGGEVFARPDFLDIYRAARERGMIVTIFTNANLVTEKVADALAAMPPFSVEVTLYGATRETYERLTGIPGSYDRCLRGIRLMKERGLSVSLKTVVITVNRHELGAMKALAAELGLPFKFDAMMSPRIDCSQSPLAVRLSPEEVVGLDVEDPERMAEWERFSTCFLGVPKEAESDEALYHCGGGVNSCAFDPRGKMSICVLSHDHEYDWRSGSVGEGWRGFLRAVRDTKRSRPGKCRRCALQGVCGMCPANGALESGDPEAPVDFLCETAHLRARTFQWAVPEHGECDFCADGPEAARVSERGTALRRRMGLPAVAPPPLLLLPVAGAPAASACSGCGTR